MGKVKAFLSSVWTHYKMELALVATICLTICGYTVIAFAQAVAPVAAAVPAPVDIPVGDFLSQVMAAVKSFGGLSWGLKVGLVINLLIATSKVSILRPFTWDKVPAALKVWLAPALAFLGGLFALGKFDWPSLMAWVMAGGGAILLDNVLEGVKQIPGLGPAYVSLIDFVSKLLKKPAAPAA